jgi:hypothetical protein
MNNLLTVGIASPTALAIAQRHALHDHEVVRVRDRPPQCLGLLIVN